MAISAYDDNQFAYRKPTRHQTMVGAERKLKRHLPLWLDILIILVVVGGAGAAGWILSHPSAHRSPGTIATDFAVQVGSGNYAAAASDVDPADQAVALKTMNRTQACRAEPSQAPTPPSSDLRASPARRANVVVQACNDEPGVQQPADDPVHRGQREVVRGMEPPAPVPRGQLTAGSTAC